MIKLFFTTLLAAHACFIIFGSTVPFDFEYIPISQALDKFISILFSPPGLHSRANLVANVLIGIPGSFLFLAVFHNQKSRLFPVLVPAALLYSALLASTAEFLQIFLPGRITMLSDILAQTTGGVIGIVFWMWIGPSFRSMLKVSIFRDKHTKAENLIFLAYMGGVLFFHAMPLDMSARLGSLYSQLHDGRIVLVPFSNWSSLTSVISGIKTIIIWIPVGWFLVKFRSWSLVAVFTATVFGAAFLEFMQIFVLSRITDTANIILGSAGGVIGWFAGVREGNRSVFPVSGPSKKMLFGGLIFCAWFILLIREFWHPFIFNFDRSFLIENIRNTNLVPLQIYAGKSYLVSFYNTVKIFVYFIVLGIIFSTFITRHLKQENAGRVMSGVFFVLACLIAGLIEFVQVFIPERFADINNVIVMVTGAMAGHTIANMAWKRCMPSEKINP